MAQRGSVRRAALRFSLLVALLAAASHRTFAGRPADEHAGARFAEDVTLPSQLKEIFSYIDEHKEEYTEDLTEAVAIQSVSALPGKRKETIRMVEWFAEKLKRFGASLDLHNLGHETLPDGKKIELPPVIMGFIGDDPSKKTVCIYGHLDVQPAALDDGWSSDPFTLVPKGDKLYGRGASDDKGPSLAFIHAIEALKNSGNGLPVNIKFIFEGMEESGSVGLLDYLPSKKDFFTDVDYVCISDSAWLGTSKPCLSYSTRGLNSFAIEVECASKDVHSGTGGGVMYEALPELIYMLNTLTDENGDMAIPGIMDDVAPLANDEESYYQNIEFNIAAFQTDINATKLKHSEDKTKFLMSNWRYPALSIHGIEGAFSGRGTKKVIPRKVIGKFSIRTVPNQEPFKIKEQVLKFLNKQWEKRQSPNRYRAYPVEASRPWKSDPSHPHYQAAIKATEHVYKVKPDLTRIGGTIPVTILLQALVKLLGYSFKGKGEHTIWKELSGKNVVLLPVGTSDDNIHAQDEKLNIRNYIEGTKLLAAYLYECALL